MKIVITISQILVALLLVSCILLQNSKGGLGSAFGGSEVYRSKRGAERIVFITTIVFGCLFFITSLLNIIIRV